MATMVRVSKNAKDRLQRLARSEHKSQVTVLDEALATYERQRFCDALRAGYDALRHDAEYAREMTVFDGANGDGLPAEPLEN